MVVEIVAARAGLSAVATRVDECPGEVAIFHMLPQVTTIRTDLKADRAPVGPGPPSRKLFNVGIQNLIRI